jgi:hypothetical protein
LRTAARLARPARDRGHRRLDVGHADEGEPWPGARPGDGLGDEAQRAPDARRLEELVERGADRADAGRSWARIRRPARVMVSPSSTVALG